MAFVAVFGTSPFAIENGKGLTPPMGWRSWNLYGANVNQSLMERIMEGMISKSRTVDGKPTSLCDLGYCDVGLDDNWQDCGAHGPHKYTYHSEVGVPLINTDRFPDMHAMTTKAHSLGLTAGWYLNNCICEDHCGSKRWNPNRPETDPKCYNGDAAKLVEFGFDSVKLDGCGAQLDLDLWASLFNASGKSIMIENCHWGRTTPNATWCPWNTYRTSGDVRASYGSVLRNLQTTVKFANEGNSRPGCWAYPDMLEVGCQHGPGGPQDPGLTHAETRTHFGAWAIVSSPLVLSHDVTNDKVMDAVWPLISNKEAIAINQAWAGHSGSPFAQSNELVVHSWREEPRAGDGDASDTARTRGELRTRTHASATWQYFYKPLARDGSKVAVLMMNHGTGSVDLTLDLSLVPGLRCGTEVGSHTCVVRDVWARKNLGTARGSYVAKAVGGHDAAFIVLSSP